jgi:hypothetical protein
VNPDGKVYSKAAFWQSRRFPPDPRHRFFVSTTLKGPASRYPHLAPSGDPRDYQSLAIYWWPNPFTGRPYIYRDGRPEADASAEPLHRLLRDLLAGIGRLTLRPCTKGSFFEAMNKKLNQLEPVPKQL